MIDINVALDNMRDDRDHYKRTLADIHRLGQEALDSLEDSTSDKLGRVIATLMVTLQNITNRAKDVDV